ncbi:hypothetical protein [Actinoplanes sp. NPDC023714]|uniref:hypothetical protein n=1 Tax=Actinoplanes sp. NPDC023714 TaxID=3154322 RepID=UPI0033FE971F
MVKAESVLGRIALAAQDRQPRIRVSAPRWLYEILIAGGASPSTGVASLRSVNLPSASSKNDEHAGQGEALLYRLRAETADEKLRVGRNYLAGGLPLLAERLLRMAMVGQKTAEAAYYWALAVLSDTTIYRPQHVGIEAAAEAFEAAKDDDPWRPALSVVLQLNGSDDSRRQAIRAFRQLPEGRRDEISRHLDMLMDAEDDVTFRRFKNDRVHRVPKLFSTDSRMARSATPTDSEVASWLDFDKLYFRRAQMRRFRLKAEDLIATVTLAEPLDGSRRVRAPYGPARYSGYNVHNFLFATDGVRHGRAALDFASGDYRYEERINFRHDAVSSVDLTHRGNGLSLRVGLLNKTEIVVALGDGIPELGDVGGDASGLARSALESIASEGINRPALPYFDEDGRARTDDVDNT